MDGNTLINSLVAKSLMSAEDGQKVLADSVSIGKTVEDIILERRLVEEVSFAKVKAEIMGVPYSPVDLKSISQDILKFIPENTATAYRAVPLRLDNGMLVVGMDNPQDPKAQDALRFIAKQHQVSLGVYLITRSDFEGVLRKYAPYETEVAKAIKSLADESEAREGEIRRASIDSGVEVVEEAPIIKIVSSTLRSGVEQGASDIHIEPQRDRMRIRFRVDGELKEVSSFPLKIHDAVLARIKVLTNLKIDENRVPQDGRFRDTIFGKDIDFRVATFPTPSGEKVAIRILDPAVGLKTVEDLGLVGKNAKRIKQAIDRPYGMILVTGPTGSGKTTTLYALLRILNTGNSNIVSLEDPVEYFIDGVNQSQVKPEIGYTFASGLRQILRQDPDVIMVGEIRDGETAELAVHAALTGHIVLSTLHTNDAPGAIPRLIDMGVDPFLIPSALSVVVGQRLVRRLNPENKESVVAPPEIEELIDKEFSKLPEDLKGAASKYAKPYKIFRPIKDSKERAFTGRIALFETLEMTRELETIINNDPSEGKIIDEARRQGLVTMRQDGIMKALEGTVSMEDVIRETSESE